MERVRYNDFYKLLACMSTINRPGQPTKFLDSIKLLGNICKAMLVHNNLQLYITILDQENIDIPSKKSPH